ncbi:MAG: hydroxyisourate hydrolase [Burkholderiaceae bacterium]|jgi:5-hydroxyisourate hydrolase|nr:hydroxyisourate hydrolase [Burkholderiaceae bacterium]
MAGISTHVLNLTTGRPISGMRVELYDVAQKPAQRITSTRTNADGRTDAPMMAATAARTGDFELRFYVGEHFKEPTALSEEVLVRFSIFDAAQHYHVPMLCSPWFFNTYRGS